MAPTITHGLKLASPKQTHPLLPLRVQVHAVAPHVPLGFVTPFQLCGEKIAGVGELGETEVDGIVGQDGLSTGAVLAALGFCGAGNEKEVEG